MSFEESWKTQYVPCSSRLRTFITMKTPGSYGVCFNVSCDFYARSRRDIQRLCPTVTYFASPRVNATTGPHRVQNIEEDASRGLDLVEKSRQTINGSSKPHPSSAGHATGRLAPRPARALSLVERLGPGLVWLGLVGDPELALPSWEPLRRAGNRSTAPSPSPPHDSA
ncbi:hypothetical protein C8Q76DRAFT_790800 [Earliella scabrosa]|nr:hypothetical protein C8Q76DRAFT_790800 [Earliella scabrosa]